MSVQGALVLLLAALALASPASADAPFGAATLSGGARLAMKSCGRSVDAVTLDFAIAPLACMGVLPCPRDGVWTLDGGPVALAGTSHGGSRGARLELDGASLAALESELEAQTSAMCGEPVDLSGLRTNAALVINKRHERARLFLRASAQTMTAGGEQGRALVRVRAGGVWMPALTQQ
jgi:surface antigen